MSDAFLVGVGNLGTAILGYEGFSQHGLNIVLAFDQDPGIVGHKVNGKEVFHVDKLEGLVKRMHTNIGILTVPDGVAQDVADTMVRADVRAI